MECDPTRRTPNPPNVSREPVTESTTFEALGVASDLIEALREQGINAPFAIQNLTIADGIAGRDVCGKAQTGSGKTLAFGVPMLQRVSKAEPKRPTGLILVPTRELAVQVKDALAPLGKAFGVSVKAMYGGVSMDPQVDALRKGVEIIVGTPGRLIDLMERNEMELSGVEVMVLDEADRMADMGFMPQVQKILYRATGPHQTMLFSATLDGAVDRLVQKYMIDPVFHEVESNEPTVEQMRHHFLQVHQLDKVKVAAAIARGVNRTLIFRSTKRGADKLVEQLEREGIKAGAIHGDLRQSAREKALADFSAGKMSVLVATDVAARGIHVDGVDVVIHYDPSHDHKDYLHRSGRTARAGEQGVAVTLMLYNQENEVRVVMRRLRIEQSIVEVFSNDQRLADLRAWEPTPVRVS
ncbi:MAG: DEAD/DEAH box helicase [Acidimicrobiia bacterium]|nr:DEAD/DEAH box helicase [Acidimicrobiia bacterium]MBJ7381610.1 DEAD/DEAH box helicase [Acidimicrobiia bacterium]